MTMTISTCLRRIAAVKGDLGRVTERMSESIAYETATPPAWSISDLQTEEAKLRGELVVLKTRLAVANATTIVAMPGTENTQPLIAAITALQEIKGQLSVGANLMRWAKPQADYTKTKRVLLGAQATMVDVSYRCDLTSRQLDDQLAGLREKFASLNAVVEAANHITTV